MKINVKQRCDFLCGLIAKRFIFRPHWPLEARYLLSYGLSASWILRSFEARYR